MNTLTFKSIMKYRNFFYGLMAVWIVFFHIHDMIRIPKDGAFAAFLHLGNIGVDVFLFLSAIGLSYSVEKNTLKEFYKNRIIKLVIPFLVIAVPYYMWRDSVTGITLERIQCFILDVTAVNFWLKEKVPFWYVSLAIVMYALYPLLYKIYKRNRFLILLMAVLWVFIEIFMINNGILTHAEKALSRIPVFLLGIFVSDSVKADRKIGRGGLVLSIIVFIIAFLVYRYLDTSGYMIMYKRFTYAFMVIPMLIIIAFIMESIKHKSIYGFFNFFGGISLELYLVHNAITRILKYYKMLDFPAFTYYLWIFPLSIVLSLMFNKISRTLTSKIFD